MLGTQPASSGDHHALKPTEELVSVVGKGGSERGVPLPAPDEVGVLGGVVVSSSKPQFSGA